MTRYNVEDVNRKKKKKKKKKKLKLTKTIPSFFPIKEKEGEKRKGRKVWKNGKFL